MRLYAMPCISASDEQQGKCVFLSAVHYDALWDGVKGQVTEGWVLKLNMGSAIILSEQPT